VKDATRRVRDLVVSLLFQSTRPVKDATSAEQVNGLTQEVSIHASREGRDAG